MGKYLKMSGNVVKKKVKGNLLFQKMMKKTD